MTPEQVSAIVKSLPLRLRRVFVMRYVEGKSLAEIAETLHISARCLDSRLTKAKLRCRERVE